MFFDYGEFDTTVNAQSPGEGAGFHITPVLLRLVGGDYTMKTGPQIFQTQFRIEAFGFTKDMENIRAVLEVYSALNQGAFSTDLFANAMTTSITDFPIFSESMPYKGFDRISAFLSWHLTFVYSGQMSNDVKITIDGEPLNTLDFSIKRMRNGNSIQRNNESETRTLNDNQVLVFTGFTVFDGGISTTKIMREIKNLGTDLNVPLELKIKYPVIIEDEIPEQDIYTVVLTEGDINITQGGYLNLTFALALA